MQQVHEIKVISFKEARFVAREINEKCNGKPTNCIVP